MTETRKRQLQRKQCSDQLYWAIPSNRTRMGNKLQVNSKTCHLQLRFIMKRQTFAHKHVHTRGGSSTQEHLGTEPSSVCKREVYLQIYKGGNKTRMWPRKDMTLSYYFFMETTVFYLAEKKTKTKQYFKPKDESPTNFSRLKITSRYPHATS